MNINLDTPDADPADGICVDLNGKCSLRASIMQANFVPGADTIIIPQGISLLTRVGFDDNALGGDLDISGDLTIQGAGIVAAIVDGSGAVTNDHVFQILTPANKVSLSDLTIRNGNAPSAGFPSLVGGGIYRDSNINFLPVPS